MPNEPIVIIPPNTKGKTSLDPDARVFRRSIKTGKLTPYKPTQKQLKAEYYRSQGYSKRESLRRAGYKMAHKGSDLGFTPAFRMYMNETVQTELHKQGLTEEKIAKKMISWLDAKKTHVTKDGEVIESEDTLAQIKGFQEIDKVIHVSGGREQQQGIKRKMTLEEWTFGGDDEVT